MSIDSEQQKSPHLLPVRSWKGVHLGSTAASAAPKLEFELGAEVSLAPAPPLPLCRVGVAACRRSSLSIRLGVKEISRIIFLRMHLLWTIALSYFLVENFT